MAQGAHRGRPVAAAPVPPGSGQQNRRYAVPSTYPCRLRVGPRQRPCKTRPSARIHAGCPAFRERLSDVEAATPAVSATMVNKLTTSRTDRRPGKSQPPPGTKPAPHPLPLPGGATLARAYEGRELSAKSPGRVRRSCHPAKIRHQSVARIRRHAPPSGFFSAGAVMPLTRLSKASRCCKCTNAIPEFHVCCVSKVEGGDYLHIEKWLPKPWRFIQRFLCLHKNPFPWF